MGGPGTLCTQSTTDGTVQYTAVKGLPTHSSPTQHTLSAVSEGGHRTADPSSSSRTSTDRTLDQPPHHTPHHITPDIIHRHVRLAVVLLRQASPSLTGSDPGRDSRHPFPAAHPREEGGPPDQADRGGGKEGKGCPRKGWFKLWQGKEDRDGCAQAEEDV